MTARAMYAVVAAVDVAGLPPHPLLVHAVVVLLPLSAVGLMALVGVPRWRSRYGSLVLTGLVLSTVLAFLAEAAGEGLAARVGSPVEHAQWGERLPWAALAVTLVGGGWLTRTLLLAQEGRGAGVLARWLGLPSGSAGDVTSGQPQPPDRQPRPPLQQLQPPARPLMMLWGVLAVIMSLAVLAITVVTGHSGATATWAARVGTATSGPVVAASPTASDGAYTMDQVAEHATAASCWSAINGDVYDLTTWISQHPGGPNAVRSICGTDGSAGFNSRHAGTPEALAKLPAFKVGILLR